MKPAIKLKVDDTAWTNTLIFSPSGKLERAEVFEVEVTRVIPNYLNKFGLRYACRRVDRNNPARSSLAYKPDKLFRHFTHATADIKAKMIATVESLNKAIAILS